MKATKPTFYFDSDISGKVCQITTLSFSYYIKLLPRDWLGAGLFIVIRAVVIISLLLYFFYNLRCSTN